MSHTWQYNPETGTFDVLEDGQVVESHDSPLVAYERKNRLNAGAALEARSDYRETRPRRRRERQAAPIELRNRERVLP